MLTEALRSFVMRVAAEDGSAAYTVSASSS